MTKIIDEKQPKELKISVPPEIKHSGTFNYDLNEESVKKIAVKRSNDDLFNKIIEENSRIKEYGHYIDKMVFDLAKDTSYKYAEFVQKVEKGTMEEAGSMNFTLRFDFFPTDIEPKKTWGNVTYYLEPLRQFIKHCNAQTIEDLKNNKDELQKMYDEYAEKLFTNEQNKGESKHEE